MMLHSNPKLENYRTEKGVKHFPFFLFDLKVKLKGLVAKKGAKPLSFLDLPGEIRNRVYDEVMRSSESPGGFLQMSKVDQEVDQEHTKVKHSTAWALTQVSKRTRVELMPLVQAARTPRVALCDLAEYIQVFHRNPGVVKTRRAINAGQCDQGDVGSIQLPQEGTIIAWTSLSGVYGPLPSKGVNLLPILQALDKCPDVFPDFSSQSMLNKELAILDTLHHTWKFWRGDVAKFGILEMNLKTVNELNDPDDRNDYPEGRLCSTLTVRCKKSVHNTEDERVRTIVDWIYISGLRTMHERKHHLKVYFVTSNKIRGQPGAVKMSIDPPAVTLEWYHGWTYCTATAFDDEDAIVGCQRFKLRRGWRHALSRFVRV